MNKTFFAKKKLKGVNLHSFDQCGSFPKRPFLQVMTMTCVIIAKKEPFIFKIHIVD